MAAKKKGYSHSPSEDERQAFAARSRERTTLEGRWRKLADAVGGVIKLAEACGVNRETIRRWSAGTRPAAVVQAAVNGLAASHGVAPVFQNAPRALPKGRKDLSDLVLGTDDDNG